MYNIYVVFKCFAGKREEFIQKVKSEGILSDIRAEDGCLRYDYYLSDSNENELLLIETWQTKEHQKLHMTTPHMARLSAFKGDYIENTTLGEFELK